MLRLLCATAFFLGIHFGIAGTRVRDRVIARTGLGPYLGSFSLLSILGLAWMWTEYRAAPHRVLWGQLAGSAPAVWLVAVLVFAGVLLAVLGLTSANPTQVGSDALLTGDAEPARGVLRITRHPFLQGVGAWALAHLFVNGDVASSFFFGGLAVLALVGPLSIDRRKRRLAVPGWAEYAAVTSRMPFGAMLAGRQPGGLGLALREIGWWRPLLAIAVYVGFLGLHPLLFGVSPLPR